MNRTIVFKNGPQAAMFPDGIRVFAESAYDAVAALRTVPGFVPGVDTMKRIALPGYGNLDALRDRHDKSEVVEIELLDDQFTGAGGKAASVLSIVVGVALIVFATPLAGALAGTMFATSAGTIALAGLMLTAQGLLGALAKRPGAAATNSESDRSNIMTANGNTVRSGTRIALILGRAKIDGHYLSYQVTAAEKGTDITVPPAVIQGGSFTAGRSDYSVTEFKW